MRILYIGSEAANESSLLLEREITELQQRFAELTAQPLSFVPLGATSVEDLPREVVRFAPDILHIASHGDDEELRFAGPDVNKIYKVTAQALGAFLNFEHPPQLVYLNACDSGPIGEELARVVPAVIGSTAPISNVAARRGAVTFYERILAGLPVKRAFLAARETVAAIGSPSPDKPSMSLFNRPDCDVSRLVLHPIPRLVARLSEGAEPHAVRLGVAGCPAGTSCVVFFTDAEVGTSGDCSTVRRAPRDGYVWDERDRQIGSLRKARICAAGMMLERRSFSISAELPEAFGNYYRRSNEDAMPLDVSLALRPRQSPRS
jgi:hypothetical protein